MAVGQITTGTVPLVDADCQGGHVPIVKLDTTPAATKAYPAPTQAILDVLNEQLEVLLDIRLETLATRLAVQERMNEGNAQQHDFRELAQTIIDRSENEEP